MMNKLPFKYKVAVLILNLLSNTWRIKIDGNVTNLSNGIIVFWHGFMLPVWKYFGKYHPVAVVSLSKDGEILSQLLIKWNYKLIRGSSSRKGKEVLEDIMNNCTNSLLLMTPDGPQGPIYKMKAGAAVAGSRTGVPIYLCGVQINSALVFNNSWDKFQLPYPFTSITLKFSKAFYLENTMDKNIIDANISELERNLVHLNS